MKKKQYILNFSFGLLFLVLSFFVSNSVKAAVTQDGFQNYHNITSSGGAYDYVVSYTVGASCSNSFLLVTLVGFWNGSAFSNVSYNGVSMTDSGIGYQDRGQTANYLDSDRQTFYLVSPASGTHNLFFHWNDTADRYVSVIVQSFCEVNQTTPFDSVHTAGQYGSTTVNSGYFNITNNDSLVLAQSYTSDNTQTFNSFSLSGMASSSKAGFGNWSAFVVGSSTVSSKIAADYFHINSIWDNGGSGGTAQDIFVLNYSPSAYCGDSICQTATENCSSCASDCGICQTSLGGTNYDAFWFQNPYTCADASSCKIRFNYNQNYFTVYDYMELLKIGDDHISTTTIATSTIIENGGFFNDKQNGSTYVWITQGSSTAAVIDYEIIGHLAAYWDANTGLEVLATTTDPYVFNVQWKETPSVSEMIDEINTAASSSSTTIGGITAHDLACSAEDWANASSTLSWWDINTTAVKCAYKQTFIELGMTVSDVAAKAVGAAGRTIGNFFPFTIPTKINQSWNTSASTTLPTELSWLNITDGNGNVYLQFPKEWTGNASNTAMLIWGTDLFTPANSTRATIFENIKNLSKYLLWAAWIFMIWGLGQDIYNEIAFNTTMDKRRKEDLQL